MALKPSTRIRTSRGSSGPVRTLGLTHLALAVRDPRTSFAFYQRVLGVRATYRDEDSIEVQTPGGRDFLVFVRRARSAGQAGGLEHFGFRLRRPADIEKAVEAVKAAGGRIRERGEFSPGHPFVFFHDPDGYEVEIWYE